MPLRESASDRSAETRVFDPASLTHWVARVFVGCGLSETASRTAAEILVDADLTGRHSHGVSRLATYIPFLRDGRLKVEPQVEFKNASGAFIVDADRALGQVAGPIIVQKAIELAQQRAVVAMSIQRIGHLGALGYFVERIAAAGLIGVLMQNGPPTMGMAGMKAAAIGNNPFAFAAPVTGGPALVFDMAMSEAAFGKIFQAARAGQPIPFEWAMDAAGQPTDDPNAAIGGILLSAAGHKGLGLAMLVEILAGSLTTIIPRTLLAAGETMPAYFGAFLLVVNPDLFLGRVAFDDHVADWLRVFKAAGPNNRYPGERLAQCRAASLQNGIPILSNLVDELAKLGRSVGMEFPCQ